VVPTESASLLDVFGLTDPAAAQRIAKNWTSIYWTHPKAGGQALPLVSLSGTKSDFNAEKWPPKRANRQD